MDQHEIRQLQRDTGLLYTGAKVDIQGSYPESPGIYMSTAFVLKDLDALLYAQQNGGYMYTRDYGPNHICLEDLVAYLEKGRELRLHLLRNGSHFLWNPLPGQRR